MFEKYKINKRIKQLKKEISNGNAQAMYDLAMIFLNNDNVKRDEKYALELLHNAADNGHLQSKTYLLSMKIGKGAVIGAKAISEITSLFN